MNTSIVQHPNDVLRDHAALVPLTDIGSERITAIIESMKTALKSQPDGVAIAAPQIGASLQIFVVSGKVYDQLNTADTDQHEPIDETQPQHTPDKVFINPEIIKTSKKKIDLDEGCLSVRGYYGMVPRHEKVTVRAFDEHGEQFSEGRSGLLAQIFQHETDHLNGVLFIDKAHDLEYREYTEKSETPEE